MALRARLGHALCSCRSRLTLETFSSRRCQSTLANSLLLPATSTVERGNAFENRSLKLLGQTMSMALTRVGGKDDGGIDLLGWWWLPVDDSPSTVEVEERRRIRVVGQCKAEKKKMGPNYVRELEGVIFRYLATTTSTNLETAPRTTTPPVVAVLISQSSFTKSALLRAQSSPIPFCLLHLPPVEDPPAAGVPPDDLVEDVGDVGSALCNPALSGLEGLLKGQLEVRWERHPLKHSGRPALWWNSARLPSHIPTVEELE